ncbi:MAG: gamma-glutamyl-phosphate reductase, partial [Lentisphaeria bacterium]|nr:gamma-glutamyl-phosphate reductase [Lentisphaeria bacterium]
MTMIEEIASKAKAAAAALRAVPPEKRADALNRMAGKLAEVREAVLAANAADMQEASHLSAAFRKRLCVDDKVFQYMSKRLKEAAALPDPVGRILEERTMPSGLHVKRVAVPIGVLAMIYEARP